ncbi:unnamed protein product [Nezara viridula]|uniref:Uncharacterized protein n=1 Tax=Nezara viridula TaxID=85310 RepID=A0A9P0MQR9_NEZVI|nr:unnamed protein product [Nezara viridula]
MFVSLSWFVLLVAVHHGAYAKIPEFIHVCNRNDPMIDQCILNSVESLKPLLLKGIPELDIPSLEPVRFPEIVIAKTSSFRAVGTDVVISGASNYKITSFKSNIPKLTFFIGLHFPYIQVDANYDVNMRILALILRGNGPLQSNNTDINANAILKGHKEVRNGKTYAKFDALELKLKWKNYNVKLENLFNGDRRLGEAVNAALNQNKKELLDAILPTLERVVSNTLLDITDKITKNFTFEELFPE